MTSFTVNSTKNNDNDFGLDNFNREIIGLSEINPLIILDKLNLDTGYKFGQHERIIVFLYEQNIDQSVSRTRPTSWNTSNDLQYLYTDAHDEYRGVKLGPGFELFNLLVTHCDLNEIADCAVDFLSSADMSVLHPFVKANIREILPILSKYINTSIIIYEYECRHTYKRINYRERASICLTSSNTLLLRHYHRSYVYDNYEADIYTSDFGIYMTSNAESDNNIIFDMNVVEVDLYGYLLSAKKYNILENDPYKIIDISYISIASIIIMQNIYIDHIVQCIVDYMDIDYYIIEELFESILQLNSRSKYLDI